MMKKVLLFAASAATILSGCTKQYVDESAGAGLDGTIGFETYVSSSTKGLSKDEFIMGDQFKVIGGKTGPGVAFDIKNVNFAEGWIFDAPNFADKSALVSNYGGTPAVWRYDNPVSWGSDFVTFFAFSPAPIAPKGAEPGNGITYAAPATTTEIPKVTFEVKGGYDVSSSIKDQAAIESRSLTKQQIDLLSVCVPDQSKASRTVNLAFQHALTRLAFAVRSNAQAGEMIRINSIAVKNVATKGTLTLAHDETVAPLPGDEDYVGGWAVAATKKSFAVNLINNVASMIKDNNIHLLTDNDEALMMIPQALAGVELEVRYAYSKDGITWENYETGTEVLVKLDEVTSHWNPNKQIRYVLNITPGEVIGFTAEIESWGTTGDVEFLSLAAGKDAEDLKSVALTAGDKVSIKSNSAWITYTDGATTADLTTTEIEAAGGAFKLAVKNNPTKAARTETIVIKHANKNITVIKVTQLPGNGVVKASADGGEVATYVLKTGDKISVPQTKAAADWVLVNGAVISGEHIVLEADNDKPVVVSVSANEAETVRKATFTVTPVDGDPIICDIEQAGKVTTL